MDRNESMGFVEAIGLVSAIEIADVMVKAANVKIETVANADSGMITVICTGDLASCNAAVDAAKASGSRMGTFLNAHRIPRPSESVQNLVDDYIGSIVAKKPTEKPKAAKKRTTKRTKK